MDTSTQQTPSFTLSKTITDTDTLKMTSTRIIRTPHTAIIAMVQRLVGGTIFMFLPTRVVITIHTLTVIRTPAPTATIISGQEAIISARMK